MSTNYYVYLPACPHCGKEEQRLHLGKSSLGWCFALHIIPEFNLNSLNEWINFWQDKTIKDEYDQVVPKAEMYDIITKRHRDKIGDVPFGYENWEEFFKTNNATICWETNMIRSQIKNKITNKSLDLSTIEL